MDLVALRCFLGIFMDLWHRVSVSSPVLRLTFRLIVVSPSCLQAKKTGTAPGLLPLGSRCREQQLIHSPHRVREFCTNSLMTVAKGCFVRAPRVFRNSSKTSQPLFHFSGPRGLTSSSPARRP